MVDGFHEKGVAYVDLFLDCLSGREPWRLAVRDRRSKRRRRTLAPGHHPLSLSFSVREFGG
jgi:hypothetical protein